MKYENGEECAQKWVYIMYRNLQLILVQNCKKGVLSISNYTKWSSTERTSSGSLEIRICYYSDNWLLIFCFVVLLYKTFVKCRSFTSAVFLSHEVLSGIRNLKYFKGIVACVVILLFCWNPIEYCESFSVFDDFIQKLNGFLWCHIYLIWEEILLFFVYLCYRSCCDSCVIGNPIDSVENLVRIHVMSFELLDKWFVDAFSCCPFFMMVFMDMFFISLETFLKSLGWWYLQNFSDIVT